VRRERTVKRKTCASSKLKAERIDDAIPVEREVDFVRDNRPSFNLASFARLLGCAYSKPKAGRIDDGARRGLVSLRCGRSSAFFENLEHLYPMSDVSEPHSPKEKRTPSKASGASEITAIPRPSRTKAKKIPTERSNASADPGAVTSALISN